MKGRIKAGEGTLVGNAGEYYVMAELLKRGVIAALAPRNSPAFDILATKGEKTIRVRVKTKSEQYDAWQWMTKKDGTLFRNLSDHHDFTVLVNLAEKTKDMEYFIVPTSDLNKWLIEDFNGWVSAPGKNGHIRNPENKKRCFYRSKNRQRLNSDWDILWK